MAADAIIFDLGGVLIDWNPRHLYRKLIPDVDEMEHFLTHICNDAWNVRHDAGRPFADSIAELSAAHPDKADLIASYFDRWPEMVAGAIDGTVEILRELKAAGLPIFALSNWSAETWPIARNRFDFFKLFDGVVISGEEKLIKPDPAIYALIVDRHGLNPGQSVFIDDNTTNIAAAEAFGLQALHFQSPEKLRRDLDGLGLLKS